MRSFSFCSIVVDFYCLYEGFREAIAFGGKVL